MAVPNSLLISAHQRKKHNRHSALLGRQAIKHVIYVQEVQKKIEGSLDQISAESLAGILVNVLLGNSKKEIAQLLSQFREFRQALEASFSEREPVNQPDSLDPQTQALIFRIKDLKLEIVENAYLQKQKTEPAPDSHPLLKNYGVESQVLLKEQYPQANNNQSVQDNEALERHPLLGGEPNKFYAQAKAQPQAAQVQNKENENPNIKHNYGEPVLVSIDEKKSINTDDSVLVETLTNKLNSYALLLHQSKDLPPEQRVLRDRLQSEFLNDITQFVDFMWKQFGMGIDQAGRVLREVYNANIFQGRSFLAGGVITTLNAAFKAVYSQKPRIPKEQKQALVKAPQPKIDGRQGLEIKQHDKSAPPKKELTQAQMLKLYQKQAQQAEAQKAERISRLLHDFLDNKLLENPKVGAHLIGVIKNIKTKIRDFNSEIRLMREYLKSPEVSQILAAINLVLVHVVKFSRLTDFQKARIKAQFKKRIPPGERHIKDPLCSLDIRSKSRWHKTKNKQNSDIDHYNAVVLQINILREEIAILESKNSDKKGINRLRGFLKHQEIELAKISKKISQFSKAKIIQSNLNPIIQKNTRIKELAEQDAANKKMRLEEHQDLLPVGIGFGDSKEAKEAVVKLKYIVKEIYQSEKSYKKTLASVEKKPSLDKERSKKALKKANKQRVEIYIEKGRKGAEACIAVSIEMMAKFKQAAEQVLDAKGDMRENVSIKDIETALNSITQGFILHLKNSIIMANELVPVINSQDRLTTNDELAIAVIERDNDFPNNFSSVFISPVQRIPRYVLLIQTFVETLRKATGGKPLPNLDRLNEYVQAEAVLFDRIKHINEIAS